MLCSSPEAPYVEDITISEDGEWTVFTWTLDEDFHYTTQIIQECEDVIDLTGLACTDYIIEHGDSARLLLVDGDYSVHLLLYDRDDEVYRNMIYYPTISQCHCEF